MKVVPFLKGILETYFNSLNAFEIDPGPVHTLASEFPRFFISLQRSQTSKLFYREKNFTEFR